MSRDYVDHVTRAAAGPFSPQETPVQGAGSNQKGVFAVTPE